MQVHCPAEMHQVESLAAPSKVLAICCESLPKINKKRGEENKSAELVVHLSASFAENELSKGSVLSHSLSHGLPSPSADALVASETVIVSSVSRELGTLATELESRRIFNLIYF